MHGQRASAADGERGAIGPWSSRSGPVGPGAAALTVRSFLTFVGAWVGTGVLVALLDPPAAPGWQAVVAGMGAAFLAVAVVALDDSVAEDALKGAIFSFLGGSLLLMGLPAWVGWPLVLGPWIGFLGSRGRPPEGSERPS